MVLYFGIIYQVENFIEEQNVLIVMIYYNIFDIIIDVMFLIFDLYLKGYIVFLYYFF